MHFAKMHKSTSTQSRTVIKKMNQKMKLRFCSDLAVQNTAKGPTLTKLK